MICVLRVYFRVTSEDTFRIQKAINIPIFTMPCKRPDPLPDPVNRLVGSRKKQKNNR